MFDRNTPSNDRTELSSRVCGVIIGRRWVHATRKPRLSKTNTMKSVRFAQVNIQQANWAPPVVSGCLPVQVRLDAVLIQRPWANKAEVAGISKKDAKVIWDSRGSKPKGYW